MWKKSLQYIFFWRVCAYILMLGAFQAGTLYAREGARVINIDQKKGLPVNFIYDMVVDKYGYLWMGTPKGIVKYNGYQTKTFGFSAGLPNEDVWYVFADNQGRVFCGMHANEIGYIKNDRFILLKNAGFKDALSPRQIRPYKNGIAWLDYDKLYVERNDTLYKRQLDYSFYCNLNNHETAYRITKDFRLERIYHPDSLAERKTLRRLSSIYPLKAPGSIRSTFVNDILLLLPRSDTIWIINKDSSYIKRYAHLLGRDARVLIAFERDEKLCIKYDKGFVCVDTNYNILNLFRFNRKWLNGIDGNTIPGVYCDPLWDTCIITNTRGLFRLPNSTANFVSVPDILNGYQLIKNISDTTALWWNATKHKCIVLKNQEIVDELQVDEHADVRTATVINDSTVFIFTNGIGYLYYPHQSRFVRNQNLIGYTWSCAVNAAEQKLYYLSGNALFRASINSDSINSYKLIADERYKEVLYNAYYDIIITYNYNKVVLVKNNNIYNLDRKLLNWLGIGYIERIRADNKGNIFIKDNKKVICINPARKIYKKLFTHANFFDVQMSLQKDILVLAGSFGFSFYKIDSVLSLKHCIYRNIKNTYYSHLYDIQVNSKDILLTTDEITQFILYGNIFITG